MNHEEIKEQLPLYVLGGLDDETAVAVARHLAESCDSCAAEMREWQEVVGLLPLGVTQDGPSERVKDRLMTRVRQDAGKKVVPLRPRRWRAAWIALPLAAAASVALVIGNRFYQDVVNRASEQAQRAETVTDLLQQEQEKLAAREAEIQRLTVHLDEQQALAEEKTQHITQLESTLAQQQAELVEQRRLVSLREQELARARGSGSLQQTQLTAYEQEIAALKADLVRQRGLVTVQESELREMRAALAQQKTIIEAHGRETEQLREAVARQRGIIEVLTAPGLRVGYLQKAKLGVPTQGHVLWNERKKAWVFYAFGMPQPPPGKEYQVWFMTEREGPVSAGLFTPDQAGTGVVLAKPPSKLFGEIQAAAVTLEPAGGLPKPSGEMYLRGSL
jgi:anti-sigma-K factor RskA